MCTISRSAPPPPPPPPPSNSSDRVDKDIDQTFLTSKLLELDPDLCAWASLDPELRRACIFGQVCSTQTPYHIKYTKFQPIVQIGPTCGLVALSMVMNGRLTPDELLTISKSEGYTSNGEMFSCKNMTKLAEKAFNTASMKDISVKIHSRSLFSPETVESLLNGAVLLVPYDADVNHTPAMKNGHTAHWAVVCGIIITDKPETPYTIEKDNVYVLCRHGKSKYPCVWNLYELALSNNNLWEFSPKKDGDGLVYNADDINHTPTKMNGHSAHQAVVCGIKLPDEAPNTIEKHNVHVLCSHGKSKLLSVWNLYASNGNFFCNGTYKIPMQARFMKLCG